MASTAPILPPSPPSDSTLPLTSTLAEGDAAAVDNRVVSSLSSVELLQSMTRIAQRLFHHTDATTPQQQHSRGERAKRKRPADGSDARADAAPRSTTRQWRLHYRDEALESREAQQKSAFPLSSFLSSASSPPHFHRFATQPAAYSSVPRFLACVASLRDMVLAQSQRVRSAPPPLLDRLSFASHSLSSASSQQSKLSSSLRLCRDRLRLEVENDRAATHHHEHFLYVHRSLQRIRRELLLVSDDEQDAINRLSLTPQSQSGPIGEAEETVHIASAGVVSCFVIEIKLRRTERSEQERLVEFERRSAAAAAAGAAVTCQPLHDCIVSVKADFLQGDAELHDTQIDCELYALLASCRFAALQSKLSHALAMEVTADRYPQTALYSRKADVMAAFNECRDRSKLPCVLTSSIDGPQLSFHHVHSLGEQSGDRRVSVTPHLFFSVPSTRLSFASHPGHLFTHSLTYVGMEEMAAINQYNQLPPPSSSASTSPPTFSYLVSLTPSVVVPYSTLRAIARHAAGDSIRGQSHSNRSQLQQPSISYHDSMANTSPSATSRLSARLSTTATTQHYTLANDATLVEDACSLSYIPLTSLRTLPDIVHTLRQHIAFNQLYASCFRPSPANRTLSGSCAKTDSGAASATAVSVEVTAFPPHTLRLRIAHPTVEGQFISLDIRLTPADPHEHCTQLAVQTAAAPPSPAAGTASAACFDCHLWSVQLDRSFDSVAPCSDSFALCVLAITQSVPALVHAVVSRAKRQGAKINGHRAGE